MEVLTELKTERTGPVLFSSYKRGEGIKKALQLNREDILFEIKESGLKGRGGAGFPTATKWMLTAAAKSDEKYIICNADEGEPGTFKDKSIINNLPGLIIEGMVIAAFVTGAKNGFIYLRAEYKYLLKNLEKTIQEFYQNELLGNNIYGIEHFNFDIEIQLGAGSYVCGAETALLESLEGKRGEPRIQKYFPTEYGYLGHSTVVNNVETFALAAR